MISLDYLFFMHMHDILDMLWECYTNYTEWIYAEGAKKDGKYIYASWYQVNGEKPLTDEAIKKSYDDSSNLHHSVCTTKISFNNKDLLLGSKLYNCLFFIKGYVIEKMVNCILMDDGSAVNILPLKTIKELWIPMDKLFLSHMMIQGFN
jgi:hypothetical protein